MLLRLPHDLKDLMRDWLAEHYPDKLKHVFSLLQEARGGKDYDAEWSTRQTGVGPYAWMIGRRFETAAERLGFNRILPAAHGPVLGPAEGDGAARAVLMLSEHHPIESDLARWTSDLFPDLLAP